MDSSTSQTFEDMMDILAQEIKRVETELDELKGAVRLFERLEFESGKDPAAVSLGRRGGKKGGIARAKALSPERRSEIAKKAAEARWGTTKTES